MCISSLPSACALRRNQNGFPKIAGSVCRFYAGALAHVIEEILRAEERRSSLAEQVSPSGRISGTPSKAVAGAVKETSQGTFAKGVDTKWPETQTVAKGVTSLLPRKSDEIFNFKPPPRRQETVSVPPRG